ncbi:MAG: aspartate carbamoyltransferase catalytic subunit, partial [Myxococcaceae bacterium]
MTSRHLVGLEGVPRAELESMLSRAEELKAALSKRSVPIPLRGRVVANAFFENSTRTRSSFEIAAKLLGAEVLNWTAQGSSAAKGETFLDTVRNVDALGVSAIVIRHMSSGAALLASRHIRASVVNAGDGTHEHPSQGLLDAFTLWEKLGKLDGRVVAIVGDILHSRVARSNIFGLKTLGAKVICCGPPTLLPVGLDELCETTGRFDELLPSVDAVMMLRVQLERQTEALFPSASEYARMFGLNAARVTKLKAGAVVMHPGPINRGVELASDVADGPRSVILDQVANGVPVRMA